jgi:hypothetical protein
MRNLGLKLLSLFLAIIIWVGVVGERKSQGNIIITTPIELKNLPENLELVKISSTMVNVRLSGPLSIIKTLTPLDISLIIDVKKNIPEIDTIKYEKTLNIKLKKGMFIIAKGVKIKDILPPTIQITIEKKMKKSLKVILKGDISAKKGYKITDITINPGTVLIEGPSLLLKNRKKIETEDINLKNLKQSIELSVMLKKFDSRIIFLQDIKKVKVKITLKKIQR